MFAGLFTYFQTPPEKTINKEAWEKALSPFQTPDLVGHWHQDNALLVECRRFNTPWSRLEQTLPCRDNNIAVAFWGRLDNRLELAGLLNIDAARLASLSDDQLVLTAWRRWGEGLPERLLGDFALAVVDTDKRRLFLARDPLGVKPLYYWSHAQGVLFATTVGAFLCLKGLAPTPDTDWMARYLAHISMDHEKTGYREILKLPAGHCLSLDFKANKTLRRWHEWYDDAPAASRRDPRRLEAYRDVLEEAIRCRMVSDYPLGTENSGGIDSATITAYLARMLDEPGDRLHSFGFARGDQEPEFIMATNLKTGIIHNHLITGESDRDEDDEERITRALTVLGYPEEHSNATGHTPFYRKCELHGIRALFSGFGGDEVVTNPGRHLRYELQDQKRYGALWDIMPGNPATRLLRLGKVLIKGSPRPKYKTDLLQNCNGRRPYLPLRSEVIERMVQYENSTEMSRYDAPYRRINDWIIHGLLPKPYIPTRLENCTLVAASHGIDYQWPLWDVRLVQQYLSTPAIEKVGPKGIGRYLHRRAITGTVPYKVAWKQSKDMGYAALHRKLIDTGIINIAEQALVETQLLHPAVEELLDLPKWHSLIENASQGKATMDFSLSFSRTTRAVRWLNRWLHGASVG